MYFSAEALTCVLLAAGALATPLASSVSRRDADDNTNPNTNIFPHFQEYSDWAICKGTITKGRFPNLQAPTNDGGCVRYYRGIDITGVVTETHFFAKDGLNSACDCAIKCLERPTTCTNWVWKHTFMPEDGGKRSCTLYSSPNLPTDVTLAYNTANSTGFQLLQPGNNPQKGAPAPLTFLDAAGTIPDHFGVSGFMVQDQNNRQFC
jgi:hypothetical protein